MQAVTGTVCLLVFLRALLLPPSVMAQTTLQRSRDALDQHLVEQLRSLNSEAATLWAEAIAAEKRQDQETTAAKYQRVRELLPTFSPAVRRLCSIEREQGHATEALDLCRQAVKQEASPENLATLAYVLAQPTMDAMGSPEALSEAVDLANRAAQLAPDDPYPQIVLCTIATARGQLDDLIRCSDRLVQVAPDEPGSWAYGAIAHSSRGEFEEAKSAVEHARLLGMPTDKTDSLLAEVERRVCMVEANRGHAEQALELCHSAAKRHATAENLVALATLLVSPGNKARPSGRELEEAADVADRAARLAPNTPGPQLALCQVAMAREDIADLTQCAERLRQLAPGIYPTWYFTAIAHASRGELIDAEEALRHAQTLGLPREEADRLFAAFENAKPFHERWGPPLFAALAIWSVVAAALFVVGWMLSVLIMRSARHLPAQHDGRPGGLEASIRRAYKIVLWLCCAFYYLSIPLLLAVVVALGGGALYAIFATGHVPVQLVALIAGGVLWTVWAALKSLFVRSMDTDPGTRLDLAAHPRLRAVLDEVAERIGTRAVDNVYLTPGTDLAVTERRSSVLKQMTGGSTERCLILGVGVLDGMRVLDLKSILGHEYGHFQNRDTAGGAFALAVRRSLFTMARNLAQSGVAVRYNPAWLFVIGFYKLFVRISHGASRLQEMLCDRWAAFAYGSDAFERSLRHVIERSIAFAAHADATLKEVVQQERPLINLYAYAPTHALDVAQVTSQLDERINAKESPYDSHPPPGERIALVRRLNAAGGCVAADERAAWALFRDRDEIEQLMTALIRKRVEAHHGVSIHPDETVRDSPQSGQNDGQSNGL